MKMLIAVLSIISSQAFAVVNTINFNFQDAEIASVVKEYAKMSGQKFIIDPNAHGKITIINKEPISVEDAFNQLSSALAVNGLAISKQNDQMVILQARAAQRNLIDVVHDLPPLNPTKMVTWVINLKYISANDVNRELRLLTSNNGEVFPFTHSNQLIISDYTPNLHRVANLIKELDVPATKASAKFAKTEAAQEKAEKSEKSEPPRFKAKTK